MEDGDGTANDKILLSWYSGGDASGALLNVPHLRALQGRLGVKDCSKGPRGVTTEWRSPWKMGPVAAAAAVWWREYFWFILWRIEVWRVSRLAPSAFFLPPITLSYFMALHARGSELSHLNVTQLSKKQNYPTLEHHWVVLFPVADVLHWKIFEIVLGSIVSSSCLLVLPQFWRQNCAKCSIYDKSTNIYPQM